MNPSTKRVESIDAKELLTKGVNAGGSNKIDAAWKKENYTYVCSSKIGKNEIKNLPELEILPMLTEFTESTYTDNGVKVDRSNIIPYVLVYNRAEVEEVAKRSKASNDASKNNLNIIDIKFYLQHKTIKSISIGNDSDTAVFIAGDDFNNADFSICEDILALYLDEYAGLDRDALVKAACSLRNEVRGRVYVVAIDVYKRILWCRSSLIAPVARGLGDAHTGRSFCFVFALLTPLRIPH
jgi:hypothetical protein